MGKWTPQHYHDILASKLDRMVTSAIKRSKLDKSEPSISYQSFIEDLDSGDSFTTSLIDILVKELADRRTRTSDSDRAFIAPRSARSLRDLASLRTSNPGRGIYHPRRFHPDFGTVSPDEYQFDPDEHDQVVEWDTDNMEGVRINSDLYEAYNAGGPSPSWGPTSWELLAPPPPSRGMMDLAAPPGRSASADTDDTAPPSPPSPPPMTRSSWIGPGFSDPPPAGASRMARTNPLRFRRGPRPTAVAMRTTDFDEFALRRRNTARGDSWTSASATEDLPFPAFRELSPVREPGTDGVEQPAHRIVPSHASSSLYAATGTRRFFPPLSNRRRHDGNFAFTDPPAERAADRMYDEVAAASAGWFIPTPPITSATSSQHEEHSEGTSDERAVVFRRLRRGGVRAPEAIHSRHASPAVSGILVSTAATTEAAGSPPPAPTTVPPAVPEEVHS